MTMVLRMMRGVGFGMIALIASGNTQPAAGQATMTISGTVAYRQRMALPPDASLQIRLEDVSRSDAPSRAISEIKFPLSGKQVPITFQLPYSQSDIDPAHHYSVRAAILVRDKARFASSHRYPVITNDAPNEVAIMVEPVAAPPHHPTTVDISLPATFSGSLPCANCAAQRYTVTLRNDRTFLARRTYLQSAGGKDESFYEIGRWSLENGDTRLVLRGAKDVPEQFSIRDARTIRKLDGLGHQIISKANHDLRRSAEVDPIADSFRMSGEYTYSGDAGFFDECLSGTRFPIAAEKDSVALQNAYGAAGLAPGTALLVTLDGRLARRPARQGDAQQETLVVERFDRIWPQEHCASHVPAATLEGTYWKLAELGGHPAIALPDSREVHIILQASGRKLAGSGGCNRLLGRYELGGEHLRILPGDTTRMACPEPLINQEFALVAALRATTSYRIQGDALDLRDGQRLLARLKAQDFR